MIPENQPGTLDSGAEDNPMMFEHPPPSPPRHHHHSHQQWSSQQQQQQQQQHHHLHHPGQRPHHPPPYGGQIPTAMPQQHRQAQQHQPSRQHLHHHHYHQHQQHQQQEPHQPQSSHSHVNGIGLWRSWERNFRQPIDAMLDLVDNAVDADHGRGTIRIDNGDGIAARHNHHAGNSVAQTYNEECIQIMNSARPTQGIKPMAKILEVFSSAKDHESIGENGVGVKQASANLSNFSVVISKNEDRGTIEVGILSKKLQTERGIVLPSYTLSLNRNEMESDLDQLLANDPVFKESLQLFGGMDPDASLGLNSAASDATSPSDYTQLGQDRLLDIVDAMTRNPLWSGHPSVFCFVLARLRLREVGSKALLKKLQVEMPKTYIHLQPGQADIKVGGQAIQFQYWEQRLVELTHFPIRISRAQFVLETYQEFRNGGSPSARNFMNGGSPSAKASSRRMTGHWANHPPEPSDTMNVYCGFDPIRTESKTESSFCSLYIYSRECGRLVRWVRDARQELDLTTGGTDFCQGLTVILDDSNSTLPLTPTKQDIAWTDAGDQGQIHRKNVYAWLRAVVTGYYRYWLEQCFDKKKTELSKAVISLAPQVHELMTREKEGDDDDQQTATAICPLVNDEQFNHFVGFTWAVRNKRICIHHFKDVHVNQRNGSLIPFTPHQRQPSQSKVQKKPPPAPDPAPAHLPEAVLSGDNSSASAPDHGLCDTMATATAPPWQDAFSPIARKKPRFSDDIDNTQTASPQAFDTDEDEDHVLGASRPPSPPNPRKRNMQNTIIFHLEKKAEEAVKGKERLQHQLSQQQLAHEEREEEWANEMRRLESKTRRLQAENKTLDDIANERAKQLHEGKQLVKRLTTELAKAREGKQSDDATTASATASAAAAAATSDAHWRRQVEKLEAEKANIQEQRQKEAATAAASDARWQREVKMLREQLQSSEDQILALQEEFSNAASNGQQSSEDNIYQHFRQEDLDI